MAPIKFPHLKVQPRLTWHFSVKPTAKDHPLVVLLHNFAGTEDNFGKHVSLLNDLAFDVATFDLSWHRHGSGRIFTRFVRTSWADEVTQALNEAIKERPVITFAFSSPSLCMIDGVAAIIGRHPEKIVAMIFDSGPFEHHYQCVKNLLAFHFGIKNKKLNTLLATALHLAWNPLDALVTKRSFEKILKAKPNLPVLSVAGAKDQIAPIEFIRNCFKNAKLKNYQEIIFERGGHITSLKEEPEKYKQSLQKFLFDLG